MPDFILALAQNPFWAKTLASLVLLLYIRKIGANSKVPVTRDFLIIFWSLLGLDLVLVFFPKFIVLPLLQGLVAVAVYFRILSRYTGVNYLKAPFWVLNGLVAVVAAADPFFGFPWYVQYLYQTTLVVNWIILAVRYYNISEFNTERAAVIMEVRGPLVRFTLTVTGIVLLLVPLGGPLYILAQALLLPVGYLIHSWALSFWERTYEADLNRQATLLENNLVSLFEFMTTIGNAISEKLEVDKVLSFVVRSAMQATRADSGAVFLVDEFEDVLWVKSVEGDFPPPYQVPAKVKLKISSLAEYFFSTPIPIGKTVIGECATKGAGIFIRDTRDDPRMTQNAQLDQLYISSLILLPLLQGKKVFGVLAIASRRGNYLFTEEHFNQVKTFADYTSLTINSLFTYLQLLEKQEMEREVGIAAEIQEQLLPSKLPQVSSVNLASFSQPAKGVSGDYFDVINIRKGQILLAVCDVAGKGIPASLVMVMIRTIIHLVAHQPNMTVSRILDTVNWGIAGKVSLDRFATVALLTYDFAHHQLEYSNAAHHPLLIYRHATRSFETLDTEGIPIGLEKKTKYNQINTKMEIHDIVVLYTDGIIEAMNDKGEQYTLESLQRVILKNHELASEKLKRVIIDDMNSFVGKAKQHDDQTFLLMKVEN